MKLNNTERKSFFDYVKMFYGKGEITNYYTEKEMNIGIDEYLEIVSDDDWGDGDTIDRENVLVIMMSNRHTKIEKEIKKLKKQLTHYPKLKEKTMKGIHEVYRRPKTK